MSRSWILRLMLGVVLLVGFGQAVWADKADIKQLSKEGIQAYNAANYPEALAKWQQGLELAKKSGNQKSTGIFFGNLGLAYWKLGKFDQALEHYRQALAIKRELKAGANPGNCLGSVWIGCRPPWKKLGRKPSRTGRASKPSNPMGIINIQIDFCRSANALNRSVSPVNWCIKHGS